MRAPRVSVAMAVHNGMPFLEESVRSILAQSLADFELVIGDDGSDDGSSELLARLALEDRRIRLLRRETKSGLAASANWVIGETRAELVAIAHADDVSLPDRLARQLEVFDADPEAVLVGTLSDGIDETGRRVRPADYWRLADDSPFAPFAHSSVVVRRKDFLAAGGYRPVAEYWEDLDLYFRLAGRGRLLVVPEVLTRVRHSSISTRLRDGADRVEDAVDLMFRTANAFWRGDEAEAVIQAGPRTGRRLHPRTFVSRGSTRLWSGRRPGVLGRLWRRGELGPNLPTAQALVWGLWSEISPRSLRLVIRTLLNLRNRAGLRRFAGVGRVEWLPRRKS